MELRNINTFLHVAELHSFSRGGPGAGLFPVGGVQPDRPAGRGAGGPPVRPVGQDGPADRRGPDLSSLRPHPADPPPSRPKPPCSPAPEASGTLRVAIADSLCSALMPPLLARFHALCPRVEVSLRTATTQEMQDLLSANQADLAYTFDQPVTHPSFVRLLDEPEPCCFLAPAGHPPWPAGRA